MANSTSLSYEQVDWNKEVQDQDDVLRASDTESGDFAQSDGTKWIPKSVSEMKTILGIEPQYQVIQFLTGNGSTVANNNATLFTNNIPNSSIATDWTRSQAGVYTKAISSTGTAFTNTSFSSKKFVDSGMVFDISVAEGAVGLYQAHIAWSGSTWQINLYTTTLAGVLDDLSFAADPITLTLGLNPA